MNFNLDITYEQPVQSSTITLIKARGVVKLDGTPISYFNATGQSICDRQYEFDACEGIARAKKNATRKLNVKAVKYMERVSCAVLDFLDEANVKIAMIDNE